MTTLLYLSDVEGGGPTTFTTLGYECAAVKRRVLVFHNCLPGGASTVDPRTMHAGSPVTAGYKWAANKWIRQFRAPPPPLHHHLCMMPSPVAWNLD